MRKLVEIECVNDECDHIFYVDYTLEQVECSKCGTKISIKVKED